MVVFFMSKQININANFIIHETRGHQYKKKLMHILHSQKDRILSYGVRSLSIFGSFAKDHNINKESDIDFLVEFEAGKKTFDNFIDLNFFLEDITGRKVELLTQLSLSKFIGPHIEEQLEHVCI